MGFSLRTCQADILKAKVHWSRYRGSFCINSKRIRPFRWWLSLFGTPLAFTLPLRDCCTQAMHINKWTPKCEGLGRKKKAASPSRRLSPWSSNREPYFIMNTYWGISEGKQACLFVPHRVVYFVIINIYHALYAGSSRSAEGKGTNWGFNLRIFSYYRTICCSKLVLIFIYNFNSTTLLGVQLKSHLLRLISESLTKKD